MRFKMLQRCLSWSRRIALLSWRQGAIPRSFCTESNFDTKKAQPNSDEAEIEKRAGEYLDNLDDSMKRKLAVIEMEYNIRLANKDAVPLFLSNKQKKVLLQHYPTKEKQIEYLHHLKRSEIYKEQRNILRKEKSEAIQFYPFQREGTYIFAEKPIYDRTYYKFKMAQSLLQGTPIVFDVGYPLSRKENEKFVKMICHIVMYARLHCDPPCIIVAGLGRNKILKELIYDREEINKMMVDFRDEAYEEIFPNSKMVYLSDNGQEMTEFNGDAVHVIFSGNRMPRITQGVEEKKFPHYHTRFADKGPMLQQKAKILMDLSLEKDVDVVMRKNIEEGLFTGRQQRHEDKAEKSMELKRQEQSHAESNEKSKKLHSVKHTESLVEGKGIEVVKKMKIVENSKNENEEKMDYLYFIRNNTEADIVNEEKGTYNTILNVNRGKNTVNINKGKSTNELNVNKVKSTDGLNVIKEESKDNLDVNEEKSTENSNVTKWNSTDNVNAVEGNRTDNSFVLIEKNSTDISNIIDRTNIDNSNVIERHSTDNPKLSEANNPADSNVSERKSADNWNVNERAKTKTLNKKEKKIEKKEREKSIATKNTEIILKIAEERE